MLFDRIDFVFRNDFNIKLKFENFVSLFNFYLNISYFIFNLLFTIN